MNNPEQEDLGNPLKEFLLSYVVNGLVLSGLYFLIDEDLQVISWIIIVFFYAMLAFVLYFVLDRKYMAFGVAASLFFAPLTFIVFYALMWGLLGAFG